MISLRRQKFHRYIQSVDTKSNYLLNRVYHDSRFNDSSWLCVQKIRRCVPKLSSLSHTIIIERSRRYYNPNILIRLFNCSTAPPLLSLLLWNTMSQIQIIILMNALWTLKIMVNVSSAYYFLRRGSGDLREANGSRKLTILPTVGRTRGWVGVGGSFS